MAETARSDRHAVYFVKSGKSSPSEILEALGAFGGEGRPIWKPMHLQPMYRSNDFVTAYGLTRGNSDAYIKREGAVKVTSDIFQRGLCLPSDNKMSMEQQDTLIQVIRRCFS